MKETKGGFNGLSFSGYLKRDLDKAKERVQVDNKPCGILIVSPPGRGKTTLATHILEYYEGHEINFKDYIANGFEDFNRVLANARKHPEISAVCYDEGGDIDKRRFMSDTNFKIKRILQLSRGFKKLLIMCLQDFSSLDESVLNSEVFQLMLFIPRRGKSYANYSAYSLNRMFWILNTMKKEKNKNFAYMKVYPNYWGTFKNLYPHRAEELEKYSLGAKNVILDTIGGVEEFETIDTMKIITGKNRFWVIRALKDKNVRPLKTINHKDYYAKGTGEFLLK